MRDDVEATLKNVSQHQPVHDSVTFSDINMIVVSNLQQAVRQ